MQTGIDEAVAHRFLLSLIFGGCAGIVSHRLKFLSTSGSFSAGALAVVLYTFGGWQWLFPIMVFFVPSSLLSHIRKKLNPTVDALFEKTGTRDALQVLVNGGIGGVLAVIWFFSQDHRLFIMYLGSLSAAMADTWGTEIGVMSSGKTWKITSFKTAVAGTSGAISISGSLGGLCASAIIACCGLPWLTEPVILSICIIMVSGVVGSLVDSVIGATAQAQYQCPACGTVSERRQHCNVNGELITGKAVVSNDVVNMFCNLTGVIIPFMFASSR